LTAPKPTFGAGIREHLLSGRLQFDIGLMSRRVAAVVTVDRTSPPDVPHLSHGRPRDIRRTSLVQTTCVLGDAPVTGTHGLALGSRWVSKGLPSSPSGGPKSATLHSREDIGDHHAAKKSIAAANPARAN
jgi:hypothetical protein